MGCPTLYIAVDELVDKFAVVDQIESAQVVSLNQFPLNFTRGPTLFNSQVPSALQLNDLHMNMLF